MIPIFACMLALIFRRRVPEPLKFFTGFCLIANGTYLAVGTMWRVGDARDLLRMNVHPAELISVGAALMLVGLAIWHRLKWLSWRAMIAGHGLNR